jgi:thiamine monophosphate synthase
LNPISKPAVLPELGFDTLSQVCDRLSIPVFALGGITTEHEMALSSAGAMGFAGISWLAQEVQSMLEPKS